VAAARRRRRGVRLAVAAAILAGAAALSARFWRQAPLPVAIRLVPLTHGEGNTGRPSFSPDGASVVYASDRGGNWDLWVGLLNGDPPVRITDTPEAEAQPAWSPDGARVAFVQRHLTDPGSDIYLMPALGGHARRVVEGGVDPAWSPDGRLLAFAETVGGWSRIDTVSVEGGERPRPVTALDEGYFQRGPAWTPDGRSLVYNRSPGGYIGELLVVRREGGTPRPVTHDPKGTANLSAEVTPDGRYVVHVSDRGGALNLWRIPLAGGAAQRLTSGPGQDFEPAVAADGRRIAFVNVPLAYRLLDIPLSGGDARVVASFEGSEAWAPDVSPDGSQVAFSHKVPGQPWRPTLLARAGGTPRALLEGVPDVFWVRYAREPSRLVFDARGPQGARIGSVVDDGSGLAWLTPPEEDASYPDLSPDGSLLAYVRGRGPNAADIVLRPLAGGAERVLVLQATLPRFAPDGRRLAFARSRSYAGGVGVIELDGGEPRWLTSSGTWPTWLPEGRSIAYADVGSEGDQLAWRVDAAGGVPRRLGDFRWQGTHYPYVVTPDGQRLLSTDSAGRKSSLWLAEF
jgi:Tol biopolymer transport system component